MSTDRRPGHLRLAVTALAVVVVIGVVVNFLLLQHRAPGVLDGQVVAQRIAQDIQFNRHLTSPPAVRCPPSEPQRAGTRFACTATVGGRSVTVVVSERDSRGQFDFQVAG